MAISNLTVSSGSMSVSKVVVIDGNNLIVRIDRGVAGRGITDVEAVEIDNSLYLVFSFTDGTTETVGPVGTIQYIGQAPIVVNGSTISLSTVPVNLGGTGATTAANARTNLNAANQDTTISAGTGLSGGGSLAANRTLSIANTAVTAAAYGSASKTLTATVNAQGQLTALADTDIAIANTQISGLGTMSTQNATSVAITGGTITGITDLAVADGGTGASDASGARTNLGAAASAITISAGTGLSGGGDLSANRTLSIANTAVTAAAYGSASNTLTATVNAQGQLTALAATPIAIANTQVSGLGTMSTQNANSVTITGGTITGITDLAIADGGTGASNAADARTNLGLGTAAVLNAGVALGVATLDAGGTVPLSQIPASIQGGVSYQGSWNAATNTPTLTSSVGSKGYYYVVSVAGSTNLNGITDWLPGDWAIFNGSVWEQIDNTDTVASVNGYVGAVVLTAADVGAPPTTRTISAGTGLTGGGDLSANRTITLADTTVTAGSYGSASSVPNYTVNAQGQLTAAASTAIAINGNQITSGTVAIANGGSGTNTAQGAMNAFAGAVTSGSYLRGNGTNVVMSSIQAADVPTLNQNTTGTAANVTGIVGTANGGTGLSSFTANGVVYASSTSALATGSALTFDGTDKLSVGSGLNGQLLLGTTAAYQGLIRYLAAGDTNLYIENSYDAAAASMKFRMRTSGTAITPYEILGSGVSIWGVGGTEKLRLTATSLYTASDVNVGIGTSSPGAKIHAYSATGSSSLYLQNGASTRTWKLDSFSDGNLYVGIPGVIDAATFTPSGNLGLGVTPSAWASGWPAFQVGRAVMHTNTSDGRASFGNNYYVDGTNAIYIASANATQLMQVSGEYRFYTAPSGTAGDPITFTQAMTLDASWNLGVGTTSPSSFGVIVAKKDQTADTAISVSNQGASNAATTMSFTLNEAGVPGGWLRRYRDGTGNTEIGFSDALLFTGNVNTTKVERARITSGGELLVGKTSAGIVNIGVENLANGAVYSTLVGSTGATSSYNLYSTGASAYRFYVDMAGTVFATSIVISAISDQRLKENVRDIDAGLDQIMALKPRRFDWKEGKGQDKKNVAGFIAHEFEEVFPECVGVTKAGGDGIEYKNINHETLIPTLVKAIQEQQTLITALTARVAALESSTLQ